MSSKSTRAIYVLAFPVVLSIGIVLIPVVTNYNDHTLAEQAVSQTVRWFLGHIIAAIGFALSVLSVSAIDVHLQQRGRGLSPLTLPLITVGAGLYAAGLGADGIGPLAVRSAGHSPVVFFDGGYWVTATFVAATVLFAVGLITLVGRAIQERVIRGPARYVTIVAALVFLVAPAVFSGWALYGVAVASFGIFAPFALVMKRAAADQGRPTGPD